MARPDLWPGVHSVHALRDGEPLRGVWYDRTAHSLASRRVGESPSLDEFASEEVLVLDPLPCWAAEGLSEAEGQHRVAELVELLTEEAATEHRARGTRPSEPEAFLRVHPHQRPARTKHSPAPLVHAVTREVRHLFAEAYAMFLEAYQDASALLRAGHRDVEFPEGSFPPRLPFVPALEPGGL